MRTDFGAEPGFIGPVGAQVRRAGRRGAARPAGLVAGANKPDMHLRGRRARPRLRARVGRRARAWRPGDRDPTGAAIRIEPAIEVGNIFKLGTRYSEPLGATLPRRGGQGAADLDGLLRHRARRASVAAAIEQFADEQGIAWPRAVAPFDVELVTLGKEGEEARDGRRPALRRAARARASTCSTTTATTSAGEKFADAELLGCPLRADDRQARASRRGEVEVQVRRGQEKRSLPLEGAAEAAAELWREPPLTFRRLRRPRPLRRAAAARRGAGSRCNPWTIPNAIGFARIALVPVFLVVALELGRRPRTRAARSCSPSSPWTDYFDGMAARITGQYSRLGALLDPLTDRAARALRRDRGLAVRAAAALGAGGAGGPRAFMLVLTQARAPARHRPRTSTCSGRWAVWPVMGALGARDARRRPGFRTRCSTSGWR